MSAVEIPSPGRLETTLGELGKLSAFLRRDFLVAWSYRMAFFTDGINLFIQAVMFYFIGRLVDPSKLPTFGGSRATYMEFVAIGIALSAFVQLGLGRVSVAIRQEQLIGTLESLLLTPTSTATLQLGSVAYDLVYIPLRTALFLVLVAVGFGVHFDVGGLAPAAGVLLFFIPFVWGLGVASAAAMLTFRRGTGGIGYGMTFLTLASGAYFPLELLPGWFADVARVNPVAIAIHGMREALLGGAGWSEAGPDILLLAPMSAVSLAAGILAFRVALRRERRRGTLGLY